MCPQSLATDAGAVQARSHVYGMLARLFRAEVDGDLLARLREPTMARALGAAGLDVDIALPGGDDGALLEDLAREYCRLFLLTSSPHESVQRGEGQLWGAATVQVQACMDEWGLAFAADRHLLPDHLATELEVMQLLAEAEAQARLQEDHDATATLAARQQAFLQHHLLRWAPAYLQTASSLAAAPFYRKLAQLAADFLVSEYPPPERG